MSKKQHNFADRVALYARTAYHSARLDKVRSEGRWSRGDALALELLWRRGCALGFPIAPMERARGYYS